MWVKLDDRFAEHPKLMAAGALTWGVWTEAMAYCNRNLTDGYIPDAVAEAFGGRWRTRVGGRVWQVFVHCGDEVMAVDAEFIVSALVESGLWHRVDGGYQIHDYADFQLTRAEVMAERERRHAIASAGGRAAKAKRDAKRTTGSSAGSTAGSTALGNAETVLDPCSKSAPVTRVPIPEPHAADAAVVAAVAPAPAPARAHETTAPPAATPTPTAPSPDLQATVEAYRCGMPATRGGGRAQFLPPGLLAQVEKLHADFGGQMVRQAIEEAIGAKNEIPGPAYLRAICQRMRDDPGGRVTGQLTHQRRHGADPGVFRAKGPVASMEDGNPDEAFGPRLPEDQEDDSHAV